MVEFGLKLRDNIVQDWTDFYIRYEKLKQILKTLKSQLKAFSDLEKKDEELANQMRQAWLDGSLLAVATPEASTENMQERFPSLSQTPRSLHGQLLSKKSTNETTKLLQACDSQESTYGSNEGLKTFQEQDPSSSDDDKTGVTITNAFLRATSGVSNYFKYPLERQFKDVLKTVEKSRIEFEAVLQEDIQMVNSFYNDKLQELEGRLQFLKESVASSVKKRKKNSQRESNNMQQGDGDDVTLGSYPQTEDEETRSEEDIISTPLLPNEAPTRTQSAVDLAKSIVRFSSRRFLGTEVPSIKRSSQRYQYTRASVFQSLNMAVDMDDDEDSHGNSEKNQEDVKRIQEAESIQRAIVDQYRTAKLLHNYAIMNYTGFVKIVKKHDKTNPFEEGKFKNAIRPSDICNEGKAVEDMEQRLERYYAVWFCNGNRSEARAQMLPKKGDSLEMDWGQLRLGYRLGMCTILALWVCWDCIWGVVAEHSSTIGERTAFPAFRACGGLLTLQWFWGMSTWVWSRYRINYIYLFDFDPRIVNSPLSTFNSAVDNTMVFLICMLLYYKAGAHDIPGEIRAGVFPFLLFVYTSWQLIFPLRTRIPMWTSVWKVASAPLTSPSFYHGYVGDIFTSMVKVFQDLAWTICFIFNGDFLISEDAPESGKFEWANSFGYRHVAIPLLTLLPLWFRFNQCLRRYADSGDRIPHLANAFKYALSQTVTLFGAFHPLYLDLNKNRESSLFQGFWMFAFIGSSLYSFVWDVCMDWGLGIPKYGFLGPRLMYPRKAGYYAIIAMDFVLRFAWVLTLIPPGTGATFALPGYLTAVSMVLELYRRTLWGFLRLEQEHRNSTSGFRRVGFVPLHFSTGHVHEYEEEKEHRGFSVLLEVVVITMAVVAVSFGSVVAAQHATERAHNLEF